MKNKRNVFAVRKATQGPWKKNMKEKSPRSSALIKEYKVQKES